MSDNYTVGTHGERIADGQPRGRIWGFNTTSVAVQNPPSRPLLFACPQQYDQGYGRVYHQQIPSLPPAPGQHFVGGFFRIEQDSTEQPFARTWRVAVLPSITPSPPPNRPTLFVAPEQTNLDPFARVFRVAVLPSAAVPPFRRIVAAPEQVDLQPFARLFRAADVPQADVPRIRQIFSCPPVETQSPSFIVGYQPLNSDFIPDTSTWVTIPNLIGLLQGSAEALIAEIFCTSVVLGTSGSVAAQIPAAFTLVPRGTVITITLGGPLSTVRGRTVYVHNRRRR